MKNPAILTALTLLAALGCAESNTSTQTDNPADPPTDARAAEAPTSTPPPPALAFEMPALDGTPVNLADYRGRVVLIVNTASQCGLTPQYEQLQALHEQYADAGLAILGFPANNFGGQEPGSDKEIAAFCEENYGVGFDMFAKISVKGDDQHPLYAYLTGEETNPDFAGDITWNFEKFLLDREGNIVARFDPRTTPDAPQVIAAIEAELQRAQ